MSTKFETAILFFQFIFLRFTVGNECHREGQFVKVESADGLPQINALKVTTRIGSSFCSVECLGYPGCNSFAYLTYTSSENCLLSGSADGESVSGSSGVVEIYKKVLSAVVKGCDPNPCKSGGTCMYTCEKPYYHCVCPEGTSGKQCEPISFQAIFNNLGQMGSLGPTTIGNRYNGKDHEGMVTLQNGIQHFTVPYTGMYTIVAVGAAGGYGQAGSTYRGKGAKIGGNFDLVKGQVLQILVGQAGLSNAHPSSGGGGGTFVVTSSVPLIIAGGGGGVYGQTSELVNAHASVGSAGKSGYGGATFLGGTSGSGASDSGQSTYDGGGGGGFYTSGRSSPSGGAGGKGFLQGGNGGTPVQNSAYGGFGGGGGGYGAGGGSGGGGGYSGGASGNNYENSCGGGGGSYNSAKQNIFKQEAYGVGHGYVIITRIR